MPILPGKGLGTRLVLYRAEQRNKTLIIDNTMGLIRFNDRNSYPTFSSMLDDFFSQSFADMHVPTVKHRTPAVNVKETDKSYGLEVALPGVKKDQVNLELDHNMLTISSEVTTEKEEKESGYSRREFGYSSFSRSFTLPETVDQEKIDAKFEDGVLHVSLPKLSEKALNKARSISIG